MDNYNQGDLICVGSELAGGVSCVGFNNGGISGIFEASVSPSSDEAGAFAASYRFLKPDKPPQTPGPWPCAFTPSRK